MCAELDLQDDRTDEILEHACANLLLAVVCKHSLQVLWVKDACSVE